ncbi:FAD-dependent monooxygenase [Novosphingobium sp. RL4]|uniref:FAD-dependent monooxygenase n=1 Tax=Novosphingobium sp. RL4 TaxID=3109595 RepID=UPI002D76C437|nr:FAD-dependent monooxygenase [Novosphingobium sp. RL4]WRT94433.1 FAD-dependent monooxygenase [Novosphingobium sp. RL4]
MTVAAEVAAVGHSVVVLERRTDVVESRAGTLLPRVLELFDTRGVAERFIRKAREIRHWPFNPYHIWAGLQPVDWRLIESRYPFTLLVPQNYTEEVLQEWAREGGADIRMGHEVTSIEMHTNGVTIGARTPSGEAVTVAARYVVGADGARSTVRKSLEVPFEGHGPTFTGIIADAIMDFPFEGGLKMVGNELGWGSCFPFGKRIVRFSIVHAEGRSTPRDVPVTLDEFKRCITDIYGSDLGCEGLAWASRYTDQMRIVPSLRKGRAFLVGESARIHYPASGVGMNFCIQDAFNLGWKLSHVLSGYAAPELLDTYNEERMAVAQELLQSVKRQCAVQFDFSEEGMAYKRDLEARFLPLPEMNRKVGLELNGIGVPYPRSADAHPTVGLRAKDLDLVLLDGTASRVYEQLHARQFVLLDLTGVSITKGLDHLPASVRVVEAKGVRLPADERDLQAILIRPDGYVAWASDARPTVQEMREAIGAATFAAELV